MSGIKKSIINYFMYGFIGNGSIFKHYRVKEKAKAIAVAKSAEEVEVLISKWFGRLRHGKAVSILLYNAANGHYSSLEKTEEVIGKIENLIVERISGRWDVYFQISFILQSFRRFDLAYSFREKGKELVKGGRSFLGNGIVHKIISYIEDGDFDTAGDMLNKSTGGKILKAVWAAEYRDIEDFIASYCYGRKVSDEYADLVDGKNIIVLGPAPIANLYTQDEEKDLIVRFAYRGEESIPEEERDIKTDISYYNGDYTDWFFNNDKNYVDSINDLKYVCLKDAIDSEKSKYHVRMRKSKWSNLGITFGSPNMVPIFLADMFHYNPSRIKICHSNLYASKNPYAKGYDISSERKGVKNDKEVKVMTFFAILDHDPMGQFNYLKHMYEDGKFEADEELDEVLHLTAKEYAARITETFR